MITKTDGRPKARLSLLGLLVVLMAAGALALVAAMPPFLKGAMARMRGEVAAEDVGRLLGEARDLAISRNRTVRVLINQSQRSIEVEGGSYRKLPDGVSLSGPPPGPDRRGVIRFHPDGTSDGGQIVLGTSGRAWSFSVERLTGQVRVYHASAR